MEVIKKILLLVAVAGICSLKAAAQGGLPEDPDGVPLDGGLSIALVAAAGYGAKKLMKKKDSSTAVKK